MSIQSITSNPLVVDFIKSNTLSGAHKIGEDSFSRDFKPDRRNQSSDKNNAAVTEKKEPAPDQKINNYHYLPASPVNHSTETKRLLLEAKKTGRGENQKDAEPEEENSESEIVDNSGIVVGKGSYIVINERPTNSGRKLLSGAAQKWRERINYVYRVGFMKEPGTLVNLTI